MAMGNVHALNQDDVLNGEDLSPSEFSDAHEEDAIHDEKKTSKKSTLLPLVGGILVAIVIVGFFGWKILTPYFAGNNHGGSNRDAFAPIAAATPRADAFAPEASDPLALNQPHQALPVPSQGSGVPNDARAMQTVAMAPPQAKPDEQKIAGDKAVIGQAAPVAEKPTPLTVQAPSAGATDIAQINKRIDGLDATLSSLKETVEKLQAAMQNTHVVVASRPHPAPAQLAAAAKPSHMKTATTTVAAKKPESVAVAAKKPADGVKTEAAATDSKPSGDVQLQAVLQDRAWFKTKTGETITVSAGDEVKGVGIVQQIDADSGRVIFPNGVVYR